VAPRKPFLIKLYWPHLSGAAFFAVSLALDGQQRARICRIAPDFVAQLKKIEPQAWARDTASRTVPMGEYVASVVARGAPLEKLFMLGYKPKLGHLVE
jgi:hypothetical protein